LYEPSDGAIAFMELISKDPPATKKFFETVFGWKVEKRKGAGPEIWLFEAGNGPGGHMIAPMGDTPVGTVSYVLVSSVTAVTKKIIQNGGKIIVPKFEIPEAGWFSMYEAPGGIRQAVFQPKPKARK
jgi:uncharacterized protein